ncbi:MAG: type II toxin-antitoxin system YhaV family toxin [Desulfoplanes sp.]|jgi:toxin YhaV
MERHGWTLLFHDCFIEQMNKLDSAVQRALKKDPTAVQDNANFKLFAAISRLILEVIPQDPNSERFRQGNTMGPSFRHWRRAKIGRRFRLFFRFDSVSRVIVFAWVNDSRSLRSSGSSSDPYSVFQKMLTQGHPPDDWDELISKSNEQTALSSSQLKSR